MFFLPRFLFTFTYNAYKKQKGVYIMENYNKINCLLSEVENLNDNTPNGLIKKFYKSLPENEKNDLADVVIANLTPSQILDKVEDKDTLYRMLWADYLYEDVYDYVKGNGYPLNESGIQEVINRYVYNGDYDCNLSYWDNINNLVQEALEKESNKEIEDISLE